MSQHENQIADQPAPIPNHAKPVWETVIDDMRERDNVGRSRYGTPLQAHNGRDPLVDAYQEGLDLVVYLRQEIIERARRTAVAHEIMAVLDSVTDESDDIRGALIDRAIAALAAARAAFP